MSETEMCNQNFVSIVLVFASRLEGSLKSRLPASTRVVRNYHCDARKALIGYGCSHSSIDNRIAPNYRLKGGEVYPSDSFE